MGPLNCTYLSTLALYPNECNYTLTSGTKNIYPYPYIDVDEQGHWLRILHVRGQVSNDDELPPPPRRGFLITFIQNGDLRSLSQYGVCFLATTLYAVRDIKSNVT